MQKKYLIINADDFGLTTGVCDAIVELARQGCITSTTVLVTQANRFDDAVIVDMMKYISCGLHFCITCGSSLAQPESIASLVNEQGIFKSQRMHAYRTMVVEHVVVELRAQLAEFVKRFYCLPSHIDTHHHVHFYKAVNEAVSAVAKEYGLPVRQRYLRGAREKNDSPVMTPQRMLYRFSPKNPWTTQTILNALKKIQPGITELCVHPGFVDDELRAVSSFVEGREGEFYALASNRLRDFCEQENITLVSYNMLKGEMCA